MRLLKALAIVAVAFATESAQPAHAQNAIISIPTGQTVPGPLPLHTYACGDIVGEVCSAPDQRTPLEKAQDICRDHQSSMLVVNGVGSSITYVAGWEAPCLAVIEMARRASIDRAKKLDKERAEKDAADLAFVQDVVAGKAK